MNQNPTNTRNHFNDAVLLTIDFIRKEKYVYTTKLKL